MSYSLRYVGIFSACFICFAALGRVGVAVWLSLFGSIGVGAGFLFLISAIAAVIAASWLNQRITVLHAKRTARLVLEREWQKWGSQIREQKPAAVTQSTSVPKKVA